MTVVKSDSDFNDKVLSSLAKDDKAKNVKKELSVNNQDVNIADSVQENLPLGDLSAYMLNALNPTYTASVLPFGNTNPSLVNSSPQQNDLQTLAAVQLQLQALQQQQQQQQILQMASLLSSNTTTMPSTATTTTTSNLTTSENSLNPLSAAIPGVEGVNMNDFQTIYLQMLQYYYQLQLLKTKSPGAATPTLLNNQLLSNYSPNLLQQQLLSSYVLQQQQQLLKSLDLSNYGALMNSLTPEQMALFGLNPLVAATTTANTNATSATASTSSTLSSTLQKNTSTKKSENNDNKSSTKKNKPLTTTTEKVHILPNLHDSSLLLNDDKSKNFIFDPLFQASNLLYQYPYSFPLVPILPQHGHDMLLSSSIKKIQPNSDGPILKCPEPNCNKVFTRAYNLKSHQLSHSGVRPFKCKTCQTSFVRKHDLKRHERLHTGVKPYVCSVCHRGFYRSDALSRHEHSGTCSMNTLSRSKSSVSAVRTHKSSSTSAAINAAPYPPVNTVTNALSLPSTTSSSSSTLLPASLSSTSTLTNTISTPATATTSTTKASTPIATTSTPGSSNARSTQTSKITPAKILPSTANLLNSKSLLDTLNANLFMNNEIQNVKPAISTTTELLSSSLHPSSNSLLNPQLSSLVNTETLLSSKLNSLEDLLPTTLSSLSSDTSSLFVHSLSNLNTTNSLIPTTLPLSVSTTDDSLLAVASSSIPTTTEPSETSLATTVVSSSDTPFSLSTALSSIKSDLHSITEDHLESLANGLTHSTHPTSNTTSSDTSFLPILTHHDANLAESVLSMHQHLDASLKSSGESILKQEK